MAEWVQSKYSKDSEKFKVFKYTGGCYLIGGPIGQCDLALPDSEYVPCPPPERWERVEATVGTRSSTNDFEIYDDDHLLIYTVKPSGLAHRYRVVSVMLDRKVEA